VDWSFFKNSSQNQFDNVQREEEENQEYLLSDQKTHPADNKSKTTHFPTITKPKRQSSTDITNKTVQLSSFALETPHRSQFRTVIFASKKSVEETIQDLLTHCKIKWYLIGIEKQPSFPGQKCIGIANSGKDPERWSKLRSQSEGYWMARCSSSEEVMDYFRSTSVRNVQESNLSQRPTFASKGRSVAAVNAKKLNREEKRKEFEQNQKELNELLINNGALSLVKTGKISNKDYPAFLKGTELVNTRFSTQSLGFETKCLP
jgi:hypothetical protein